MKPRKILLATLAVLALLGLSLVLGFRKTITLTIDGQPRTLTTFAPTVGSLLRLQGVSLGELDIIEPPLDRWLQKYQVVNLVHAVPVQIWADRQMISFTSPARMPSYLLAQAGLVINPGDLLLSNGRPHPIDQPFPANTNAISLQINRAHDFSLVDNGTTSTFTSSAASLGLALWEAGIGYIEADRLSPPSSSLLFPGMQVNLTRARLVTVLTSSDELQFYTTAVNVGEALADGRLALQGLDYSLPAPDEPIPADGLIRLVRVREDVLIEQTPLPFEILYQPVADLEIDNQTIVQTGEYGLTAHRIRIRFENGAEVSRVIESEWVARQPQPRIIGYGTMIVMHTTTVDGITIDYWRAITMWATSYRPLETSNTTASGLPLQHGVAAVDIRYIPFYTRMYVPGYGYVIAADVGGGVRGRWIDLGYSNEDYVSWHSYVTVYFLWPPPDNIVYIFP